VALVASAATLFVLWWSMNVLLAVFAGVLLALLLGGLADCEATWTPLPRGVALMAVMAGLAGVVGLGGWLLADSVAYQVGQLAHDLPRAFSQLRDWLAGRAWGRELLAWLPAADALLSRDMAARMAGPLASTLGTTLAVITNTAVVLFVGLYVAARPEAYRQGVLALVPPGRRCRAEQVLHALAATLRWWLVGKVVAMTVIGAITTAGLWLIGVPLALVLGLVAGLTNFVPYLGPILGFLPALALALVQSSTMAVWVFGLYVGVQMVESYLLTPLIQERAVWLPPAVTISAQVILGVTLGWLGLLLATPITAAIVVLIKMLYVEDALHEPAAVRAASSERAA
jgi:predicted PurR-regulated permease PerM